MKKQLILSAILLSLNAFGQNVLLQEPGENVGNFTFAFLPDGKTIAGGTAAVTLTFNGKRAKPEGGEVILWDAKTGKIRKTLGSHEASVGWLTCSPDGAVLASASQENGLVKIWDLRSGSLRQTLKVDGQIGLKFGSDEMLCALSPNGKFVAAVKTVMEKAGVHSKRIGDELSVWDTSSGRKIWSAKDSNAESLLVTPDSSLLIAGTEKMQWEQSPNGLTGKGSDESLVAWDLMTGKERWRMPLKPLPQKMVLAQGRGILAEFWNNLAFFDPSNGKKTSELKVGSLEWSKLIVVAPDGGRFAALDSMSSKMAWVDLTSGKITATQDFGTFPPTISAISPDLKSAILVIDFKPQIVTLKPGS